MANIISLVDRRRLLEFEAALTEDEVAGLDIYGSALEILDRILCMEEGDVLMVYHLDNQLMVRDITGTNRFQIDPEDLE